MPKVTGSPTLRRACRGMLVASAAALAVTGTVTAHAVAADEVLVYDAVFEGDLTLDRKEHDESVADIVWDRDTALRTHLIARARGLEIVNRALPAAAPVDAAAFSATDVVDTINVTDAGQTTCVEDGQARGDAGDVRLNGQVIGSDGLPAVLGVFRPANGIEWLMRCSGFSSATGAMQFSPEPVDVRFMFSPYALGSAQIVTPVTGTVPCPAQQYAVSCTATYRGTVTLTRTAKYDRPGADDGAGPDEAPPADDNSAFEETVLETIRANIKARSGRVTATCATACTGKLSAYAVARAKERRGTVKPKLIGKAKLKSPANGGKATAVVKFGPKARRLVQQRGAVEYRLQVKPAGGGPVERRRIVAKLKR